MSESRSRMPFIIAATAILAGGIGVGAGYWLFQNAGIKTVQDVTAQIAHLTIDSSRLPVASSPAKGNANAEATVVVFTDFQCPTSREMFAHSGINAQFLDKAFKVHGDRLRVVYKAFPLPSHPDAMLGAQAAQAAHLQGKFWPMFDAIFEASHNEAYLSQDALLGYAAKIGLNVDQFKDDLNSPAVRQAVLRDIDLGASLGVQETPAFFVNTTRVAFQGGINTNDLMDAINAEVRRVELLLSEPNAKYYIVDLIKRDGGDGKQTDELGRPMKGAKDALVTIVVYSDYECPFCSRVEPTLDAILAAYPNDVRVVFSHHPLSFHQKARAAHQAAYAAGLQGKFWEMHELIFKNQKNISEEDLRGYAKKIGLDMRRFEADWNSPETAAAIDRDLAEAATQGIEGTPNFLINGESVSGAQPLEVFKTVIDKKLAEARVNKRDAVRGDNPREFRDRGARGDRGDRGDRRPARRLPPGAGGEDGGRVFVDISGAPMLGDPEAPLVLVKFTDFECPFCARAMETVDTLVANNPGKIRVVFKHNPLPFHTNAKLAHQAAEAAGMQGKFWPYAKMLFENNKALTRDALIGYAKKLDLNEAQFIADMDSDIIARKVEANLAQGSSVGVKGTPHFFLNGIPMSGAQPLEAFQAAVDRELVLVERYLSRGGNPSEIYEKIVADGARPMPERRPRQPDVLEGPFVVPIDGAYAKGADNAPVTIVLFSEFECPFCTRIEPTLETILKDYDGKVRVVFKHFPLPFHANAKLASEAALAAGEQGKFWEMHALLFQNQKALRREHLEYYAKEIGLDLAKFKAALDSGKFSSQVEADQAHGQSVGIKGTPSMLINGKLVVGAQPLERLVVLIDEALKEAGK